jgi:hypothetical protein
MGRKASLSCARDARPEVGAFQGPWTDDRARVVSSELDSAFRELEDEGGWRGAWERPPVSAFPVLARPFAVLYLFYADGAPGRLVILQVTDASEEVVRGGGAVPQPPDAAWNMARDRLDRGGY